MKLLKTINPLTRRVIVFLGLFVAVSGVAGPRIISGGILFRDGFGIYGSIGKALIFGLIAFLLLVRHNRHEVTLRPWRQVLLAWLAASVVAFIIAWLSVDGLLANERSALNLVGAHGGLLLCLLFAALGSIGPKNMQTIWRAYQREIVTSALLAVLFYAFLSAVYALWQPLASVVLWCVNGLLGLSGLQATVMPPNTLLFDKFGITIAEYCSGIESIALFTGLYATVGLLDWNTINRRRYFVAFPLALLGLCAFNIARVYGLIMAGYYINPEIAFSLFHTYAGMVFFIVYSAVFWTIFYKYLLKKPKEGGKE
jgi:exosortase/archaeosortase family protein